MIFLAIFVLLSYYFHLTLNETVPFGKKRSSLDLRAGPSNPCVQCEISRTMIIDAFLDSLKHTM